MTVNPPIAPASSRSMRSNAATADPELILGSSSEITGSYLEVVSVLEAPNEIDILAQLKESGTAPVDPTLWSRLRYLLLSVTRAVVSQSSALSIRLTSAPEGHKLAPTYRLRDFLRMLVQEHELHEDTATLAWRAWNQLRAATSYALPVPDACPGPDGELFYTWDTEEHHFELEVLPNGQGEFFYRNRKTGELWGADYTIGTAVPEEAIAKLQLSLGR